VLRPRLLLVTAVLAVATLLGCSGAATSSDAGDGPATTVNPHASTPAYEGPGPYVAGTTTLDLGGRKVEVWYPAAPGAEQGHAKVVFEIRDLLPDQLKSLVPDDLNPKYETNAYRDIAASPKGPFPLVVFAHGFAGYPTEYQFLLTHLAQWGLVVAAPDFFERGLLSALAGSQSRTDETAVMESTIALMAAENDKAGGLLDHAVDASNVGTMGHSAGVFPALSTANVDPKVKTFIAMSGGLFEGSGPPSSAGATATTRAPLAVPKQPGMAMIGGRDQVAGVSTVERLYDAMTPPKRFVQIDAAGHNTFDDLCVIGADQGGLIEIAKKVGINPTDQITRLFNDGCTGDYVAAQQAWPAIRHFVTAQLRYELGLDPVPVGLGPGVASSFAPVQITYRTDP
jgi:dienelactone hydrolase